MPTSASVDATVEGLPTPSLSKHSGNPDYAAIKEAHQLLTVNTVSIEYDLGGGQNGYIGLILPPEQYSRVSGTAFVLPTDPGRRPRRIRESSENTRNSDVCITSTGRSTRTVDSALKNQLLVVFDNPYLSTLKNEYTG